jgi:hypothetical protein
VPAAGTGELRLATVDATGAGVLARLQLQDTNEPAAAADSVVDPASVAQLPVVSEYETLAPAGPDR